MVDYPPDMADITLDITCPSCDADLSNDERFLTWQVCGSCGRHFAMPAIERANALVDEGTFAYLHEVPDSVDAHDVSTSALDRLASARERTVVHDAVVTGTGEIGGTRAVIIALDDQLVSSHIGALGAEKIIQALEYAQARRLPVISIIAGGSQMVPIGPLAMVQGARLASVAAQVQALGIPMIGILTHPTSAAVFQSYASLCDLVFAEPGTSVGVVWAAEHSIDAMHNAQDISALLENGWIDGVLPRPEQGERLAHILGLISRRTVDVAPVQTTLPTELDRPLVEYLDIVLAPFTELRGDRMEHDDRGVITGIGAIGDVPVAIAVQDSRVDSNVSAALRKIQRVARFAGRFELPLVMVVDGAKPHHPFTITPGESFTAAKLSAMMSVLPVPVISVGVANIQGLVSSEMMFGDSRMMVEGATYTLHAGGVRSSGGAGERTWSARECERMGLIDRVVEVPEGGVSADPWLAVRMLREDVRSAVLELSRLGTRRLLERRGNAHRELGNTDEGMATVLGELREWQDVQQSVRNSIEEWREKLEHRVGNTDWRDKLEQRQTMRGFQRPTLSEVGARLKARQEHLKKELLERAGRAEKSEESGE